ncbi:type I DNA topoisomerase [Candidatus Roizmanbacteria bacterium]|nr:type I DNA topoisomerase [Candidatus Roizmanbacteria bacterium]
MTLIIVESPTKARTFNKILNGQDFYVFATMGHVRDLPSSRLSIDYEHNFAPNYKVIKTKQKIVDELMELAKKNKEIILATDPDREGESISYHVAFLLGLINEKWPQSSFKKGLAVKRIVFHEITPSALKSALEKPEGLRFNLVYAQQARRILDRIVGYELSPLLWKKIGKNWLSAGRVQTVALRLIVEREKEIKTFTLEDYYQFIGTFQDGQRIEAKLVAKDGIAYEQKFTKQLFTGDYTYSKTTIDKPHVDAIKSDLLADQYSVIEIKESVVSRNPPPPFTTSLLQQESFHRFGYSPKMTMRLAQNLYEHGLITYHRTDSFNLADQFVIKAKDFIVKSFGTEYALQTPRGYKTKSKMAQEAHEAIRPTKLAKEAADIEINGKIITAHQKLYKLIFDRAVATQMKEASVKNIKITVKGGKGYEFEAAMQQVLFAGFLRVLDPDFAAANKTTHCLRQGEVVKLLSLDVKESETKPPPRFNEASLIKTLEEKGIGRPSTYAPIISLIQDKNYVEKENRAFLPTLLGTVISDYLSNAFPTLFALDFTAKMEQALDEIAEGSKELVPLLTEFNTPFQEELKVKKDDKEVIDVEQRVDEKCPQCNSPLAIRFSKFGKFMGCTNFPTCKFTKAFLQIVPNKFCPEDNGKIVTRYTRSRKKFYGCENYPTCKYSAWKLPI